MNLESMIATQGLVRLGQTGATVLALQAALNAAGYRITVDGAFGPGTESIVAQFQRQHGLPADGIVGIETAALLDAPHPALIETARPLVHASGWPHDDTASLLAFYGKPWEDASLLVHVDVPFPMTYEGTPVHSIQFHHKAADALSRALHSIADAADADHTVLKRVSKFSGSYNYRPVRGSARLSCHAFGVAIDFDAEHLPLGRVIAAAEMPQAVVDAFKAEGAFWGGDYKIRKDAMHFQWAHE